MWIKKDELFPKTGDVVYVMSKGNLLTAILSEKKFFYWGVSNVFQEALIMGLPTIGSEIEIDYWYEQPIHPD